MQNLVHRWLAQQFIAATTALVLGLCVTNTATAEALVASRVFPAGPFMGTVHPLVLTSTSFLGRWAAGCQARQDTDHDGTISVWQPSPGEFKGDHLQAYLWLPSGAEVPIDAFVRGSPDGRYVAVVESGRLIVLDTQNQLRESIGRSRGRAHSRSACVTERPDAKR